MRKVEFGDSKEFAHSVTVSSIYLGLSGLSLGNQPLNSALSTTVSGTVNRREEEMYLLPMYRMGSKERGGLSLEFRQEFHGKYWNNECEICSVFQQLAPQWSHCSNTSFQINWKLCWKKSHFAPTVSAGSSQCVGQEDGPVRKVHESEKNQKGSRTLKGADSSQIRQKLFLVYSSASALPSLREGGLGSLEAAG